MIKHEHILLAEDAMFYDFTDSNRMVKVVIEKERHLKNKHAQVCLQDGLDLYVMGADGGF